ncbi:MAG: hypothetical protein ACP5LJ_07720, partial [Candidatus Bipolaricaulaceae bacterium]
MNVNQEYMDFLTSPNIEANVRGGVATVCVRHVYEWPIPIGGMGKMAGEAEVIRVPIQALEGQACLGRCPCWALYWIAPFVRVTVYETNKPRSYEIVIKATDPNGDIVCGGWLGAKRGQIRDPLSEGPYLTRGGLLPECSIELLYEASPSCDPIIDFVIGWAKDAKWLEGRSSAIFTIPGNQPPQARPPELRGETTVTLTPTGVVFSPVVVRGEVFDPDGDQLFVKAPGIPPQYAGSL